MLCIADKFDPAGGRNLKFEIPPASHVAMGTAVAAGIMAEWR